MPTADQQRARWRRRRAAAAAVVVVAASIVATAAASALAPTITITPTSGPTGTTVTVTGAGWAATGAGGPCSVSIHWDDPTSPPMDTEPVTKEGSWATKVVVPIDASVGDHTVYATASTRGCPSERAERRFIVTPPPTTDTTTSSTTSTPDTTDTTSTTSTTSTTAPPDDSTTTTEPPDESTTTSTVTTTTVPGDKALELDRLATPPGGPVNAAGRGCNPDSPVRLRVAGLPAGLTESDARGGFEAPLQLPDLGPGRYEVTARCGPLLAATLDVVLASANQGASSSLAVLVFFVLVGLGLWQLRRALASPAAGSGI